MSLKLKLEPSTPDSQRSTRSATRRSAAAAAPKAASASSAGSSHFNSSPLASQPADHLLAINQFLHFRETISLFRCNRRLYDIPLHNRVELSEINFGSFAYNRIFIVESPELATCRFCLSNNLIVNEFFGEPTEPRQKFEDIQDAMQRNPRMFSSIKYLLLAFICGSSAKFDPSCLPSGLESLTVCHGAQPFLTALVLSLPRLTNLKSLTFECDGDIAFIPPIVSPSLESLTLNGKFNSFGSPFSASASESLPSLETLDLSEVELMGPLPLLECLINLEELVLPNCFNQPLTRSMFPPSLKSLTLGIHFNHPIHASSLPLGLESLRFAEIEIDDYYYEYDNYDDYDGFHDYDDEIDLRFNQPILYGSLPSKLRILKLSAAFEHSLTPGVLPDSLIELRFPCYARFDQPILPGMLPSSLQELRFDHLAQFNQPLLPGALPSGLQTLELSSEYYQRLPPNVLPQSLIELNLDSEYNQPFQPGSLPSNLRTLHLGRKYSHPLFPDILPSSLRQLQLYDGAFFPLPLDRLPPALVLRWASSIRFEEREQMRSRYSIGRIVQLKAAISAALGLSTDLRFRVIDDAARDWVTERYVDAALIEQIESTASMSSDGSDSTGSSGPLVRYLVSSFHLQPAELEQRENSRATGLRKRKLSEQSESESEFDLSEDSDY